MNKQEVIEILVDLEFASDEDKSVNVNLSNDFLRSALMFLEPTKFGL
jgi:hypothetical protein